MTMLNALRNVLTVTTLLAVSVLAQAAPDFKTNCEQLGRGAQIGKAVVIHARAVQGGEHVDWKGRRLTDLPSFCRVIAIASPKRSSRILIEVWLPENKAWNGKFLGTGNGGPAGQIDAQPLASGIKRGFAAANTDMGSYPAGLPGIEFNFGNGRPEQVRDFALRSTHAMTAFSKEIIARFYSKPASRSYFIGCSTGGNQGLTEAQKFPKDYDGVIAGAPAHNRTHLHTRFAGLRQLGNRPGAAIPSPLMAAWTKTIIEQCAGRDGGAPGDSFLTNPLLCEVSPRVLACRNDAKTELCFNEEQVNALEAVYRGIRNPRTGEPIYFSDVRGAEQELYLVYGEGFLSKGFDLSHWILPPERHHTSFDFDQDLKALNDAYAKDINAMDSDLSTFARRGGKLIMYHGWSDGLISPLDSLDYYQRLSAKGLPKEHFARLFMVPGMGHCGAMGPGATDFGQDPSATFRPNASASTDIIMALDRWVEEGIDPEQLIAGKSRLANLVPAYTSDAPLPEARPICAYPKLPFYDGKGDPLSADSYSCQKATFPEYTRPAPEYLR